MDPKDGLDVFDLAFDEALSGVLKEELPKEEPPKEEPPKEEPPKEEPPKEEPPKEEPPKEEPPKEEPPKEEPPKEEPPKEDPLKAMQAELDRLKQELEKKKEPEPKEKEEPKESPEDIQKREAETKERQEKWKKFEEDWAEPAEMIKMVVQDLAAHFGAQIQELRQMITSGAAVSENERFMQAVTSAHSDGFQLIENGSVDNWIKTLPAWQQEAANQVLDKGTAQQVTELLTAYKEATGAAKQAAAAPTETPEEIAEKERRLRQMEAVNDKRPAPAGKIDPNDFEGAFKQAIANG